MIFLKKKTKKKKPKLIQKIRYARGSENELTFLIELYT